MSALYELAERLGYELGLDIEGLELGHLHAVVGLAPEVQDRLLSVAVERGWSVSQLEREVAWATRPRRYNAKPRPLRFELEQMYVHEALSIKALARRLGIANKTLREWLDEAGIERRSQAEQAELDERTPPS